MIKDFWLKKHLKESDIGKMSVWDSKPPKKLSMEITLIKNVPSPEMFPLEEELSS